MHSAASCLGFEPSSCDRVSLANGMGISEVFPYVVLVGLLVLVTIFTEIIVILVKVLLILIKIVLIHLLKGKGLSRKPVDGTRNEFLLDVLTQLVVELEALFNVTGSVVVVLRRRLGRGEEVEE